MEKPEEPTVWHHSKNQNTFFKSQISLVLRTNPKGLINRFISLRQKGSSAAVTQEARGPQPPMKGDKGAVCTGWFILDLMEVGQTQSTILYTQGTFSKAQMFS